MAAVLSEEPRLENTNEMPEDGDDEVEDLQEASAESVSKKKKKKKKKKKGQLCLMQAEKIDHVMTILAYMCDF